MFFPIVLIVIGLLIVLNVAGILTANFWGFFWGALFIAVGIKMIIMKKGGCPICGFHGMKSGCCGGSHDHNQGQ